MCIHNNNTNYTRIGVGNKPFSSKKVLVVEDNYLNAKVAKIFLEDLGFEVDIAKDGKDAIMMFNDSYDFVLLDIGLPDLDGCEVCKEIRKINIKIPIIACTASGGFFKDKCMAAGVTEYTQKPIIFDELEAVIRKCLIND
jgi:CheY-like chemotaxis protein